MRPWREGDPIGAGVVYLPTKAVSAAYTAACLRAMQEATAKAIATEPSLEARRLKMAKATAGQPEKYAIWLQNRVTEIWRELKEGTTK